MALVRFLSLSLSLLLSHNLQQLASVALFKIDLSPQWKERKYLHLHALYRS